MLIPTGKDQICGEKDKLAHWRIVPRSGNMSPNDSKHDNVEGGARRQWKTPKGDSPRWSRFELMMPNDQPQHISEKTINTS